MTHRPRHRQLDLGSLARRDVTMPRRPRAPAGPRSTRRSPRRSAATAARSKPVPGRGRTRRRRVADLGVDGRPPSAPANLAAFVIASRAASTSCAERVVERRVARGRELDPDAVQLLDVGGRLGQRVVERVRRAEAAAVEPASQLPLLPAGERAETRAASSAWRCTSASVCSTESWTRAATSARSSSRIRSVRSDPDLPDPGAEDEQECAGDRARCEQRARGADVAEDDRRRRPSSARSRATGSDPPGRSEPPRASTIAIPATRSPAPSTAAVESPSAKQESRSRRRDERLGRPRRGGPPVRPRARSRGGCRRRRRGRAARRRAGRASRRRRAPRRPRRRRRRRRGRPRCARRAAPRSGSRCAHHVDPAGADLGVDRQEPPGADGHAGVPAVVVPPEHVNLAGLRMRVDGDPASCGTITRSSPSPTRASMWVGVETVDAGEVDAEAADPDLVRRLDRGGGRRCVDAGRRHRPTG